MTPYYQDDAVTIYHGDNLPILQSLADCSVDAIVTDPPYGLAFMGKRWDYDVPSVELWAECLRVLKPGGHLLAFAGTRTQHRMAVRIEDAGFEIRDMIAWVYGSGFPKSLDVSKAIDKAAGEENVIGTKPDRWTGKGTSLNFANDRPQAECKVTAPATEAAKQWQGWGTALKPSLEPITMARKPIIGTVAANVLEHGTGSLNIDACRIVADASYINAGWGPRFGASSGQKATGDSRPWSDARVANGEPVKNSQPNDLGRWPANLIHDGSDEVVGLFPEAGPTAGKKTSWNPSAGTHEGWSRESHKQYEEREQGYTDSGSAARFFYTAKADATERRGSKHPTVKPLSLMRYLVRMVTPIGATVLDPFMGSGTTIEAARLESCKSIGMEREAEYCADAAKRLSQGVLF